jgi:hypothetical protein
MPDPNSPASRTLQYLKDTVEVASKIATVLLAFIAFYATQSYNKRQDAERAARDREQREDLKAQATLRQIHTIMGLLDPLASSDLRKRRLAVLTVRELTENIPLAIKICLAAASEAECANTVANFGRDTLIALASDTGSRGDELKQTARAALDRQQAKPVTSLRRAPVPTTAPSVLRDTSEGARLRPATTKRGWVFLGSYADSAWSTRYLDFPPNEIPANLLGRSLKVRDVTGSLNVRGNLFYEPGYDRILDVLAPGSTVRLDSVTSFANGGYYIWARAEYRIDPH